MLIGLARFSPRSAAAVATFFPTAIVTHLLTRSIRPERVDHVPRSRPAYVPVYPTGSALTRLVILAVGAAALTATLPPFVATLLRPKAINNDADTDTGASADEPNPQAQQANRDSANAVARSATAFTTGLEFGLGLIISGMASAAKVQSFLSFVPTNLSAWDPSLALVIVFGLAPNMIVNYYQGLISGSRSSKSPGSDGAPSSSEPPVNPNLKPRYAPNFELPAQSGPVRLCVGVNNPRPSPITRRFLLGAAAFGVAWGLEGVCPGPGIIRSVLQFPSWGVPWLVGIFIGSVL